MSVSMSCFYDTLTRIRNLFAAEYLKTHEVTNAEFTAIWKDVPKLTKDVRLRHILLSGYSLLKRMQKYEVQARKLKKVCKVVSS